MITFDNGGSFCYERIGEFHSIEPWCHPVRTIGSLEMILILEGTVHLREGNTAYTLQPNQILLLEPGIEHGGTAESKDPVVFYWFHFHTNLPLPVKYYAGSESYEIKQMMKRLLHITNTPGRPTYEADAQGYLIFEALRTLTAEAAADTRVSIGQITEYIRIHRRRNLTVKELAQHFHYHPDYIGKLFQQHLGVGLKEYLNRQRLELAKDLLLSTNHSLKQVSQELGYETENLFIKFFQYHEKISPTAFRQKYSNTHMNSR